VFGRRPAEPGAWAADLAARLGRLLGGARPASAEPLDEAAIAQRYEEAAAVPDAGTAIHIHGNLHLDQLIQGDVGWRVLDFEGGRAPHGATGAAAGSPLQDVAGMLRSIHDVAVVGLAEWDAHDPDLASLAERWETRNRTAFLEGYLGTPGTAELVPAAEYDRRILLSAFELDRALDRRGRRAGTPVVDRRTVDALVGAQAAS
jgi:predicted trehalose synthase